MTLIPLTFHTDQTPIDKETQSQLHQSVSSTLSGCFCLVDPVEPNKLINIVKLHTNALTREPPLRCDT